MQSAREVWASGSGASRSSRGDLLSAATGHRVGGPLGIRTAIEVASKWLQGAALAFAGAGQATRSGWSVRRAISRPA